MGDSSAAGYGTQRTPFPPSWKNLNAAGRIQALFSLPTNEADRAFTSLKSEEQADLLTVMTDEAAKHWLAIMESDDIVDMLQKTSLPTRKRLISLLNSATVDDVNALLAYAEDEAGGLMTSQFIRVRPGMTTEEGILYVRQQIKLSKRTIYYVYVLDFEQRLLGLVSFRELLSGAPGKLISEIMITPVAKIYDDTPQAEIANLFKKTGYLAIPVVNFANRMQGIVTIDDVMHVVQEENTKDIQRTGGTEALDAPYLRVRFLSMFRKRAGWLSVLFIGEMFTATAMGFFQHELEKAVVLALFIPLIISSGGNSGSQASTLVVRALALKEVRLGDWWKILWRELRMGITLGAVLGLLGLIRILVWPSAATLYGVHYQAVAIAIALSLVSIVLWGSVIGSMLPLILRAFRLDPAVACAPFVATIVDVSGLVIYFSTAKMVLSGIIL